MNPFSFRHADSAASATAALAADPQARYLAGGTTLVDLLRLDVEKPTAVVDINSLPLAAIEPLPGGGLRIGALVHNSDLARHPAVVTRYPVLAEALLSGAKPADPQHGDDRRQSPAAHAVPLFPRRRVAVQQALARLRLSALDGYNRSHAVLGGSDRCVATFPGDMPVAMAALDAVIRTRRAGGAERAIPIAELHVAYGEDPARETVLEHGELITAVDLPAAPWMARSTYLKVRDRASYEFALASTAVALDIPAGPGARIRGSRIVLGGVATKPWRSAAAEAALAGARPGDDAWKAAAAAALEGARPLRHNAFKVELARRTLQRALATAAAREVKA